MNDTRLPLLIEPEQLEHALGEPDLLVVDVGKLATYMQLHIPGAVHLDYSQLVGGRPPATGLLPDRPRLDRVFSSLGLTPQTHVVAYDDEGGGNAGRLLWTLDVIDHQRFSWLNGGIHAWANEGHPLDNHPARAQPSDYHVRGVGPALAELDYVRSRLAADDLVLLDARSADEYSGRSRYAMRAGHIPGAVNMAWLHAIDMHRNLRLKSDDEVEEILHGLRITRDKEVITYCQTHHRSSHSYMMLRVLGFPRIRGYAGAWAEWGSHPDTPIEM
jgi:thiosulfate/3-mercaptopyruvate sulfurtransferase